MNEKDRILKGMNDWNKWEDELRTAFRDNMMDTPHLEDKLKYMESLREKYKDHKLTESEKSSMKSLKDQINKLERSLYPGRAERLFKRGLRKVKKMIAVRKAQSQNASGTNHSGADPSGSRQVNGADALGYQQTQNNNVQRENTTMGPQNNDQNNNRMVNEYKRRLSENNKLQSNRRIRHRLQ